MRDFFRFAADFFSPIERTLGTSSLAVAIATACLWAFHVCGTSAIHAVIVTDAARLLLSKAQPASFP